MSLTVKELKEIAKEEGVKGYSRMNKVELFNVIPRDVINHIYSFLRDDSYSTPLAQIPYLSLENCSDVTQNASLCPSAFNYSTTKGDRLECNRYCLNNYSTWIMKYLKDIVEPDLIKMHPKATIQLDVDVGLYGDRVFTAESIHKYKRDKKRTFRLEREYYYPDVTKIVISYLVRDRYRHTYKIFE